MMWIDLIPWKWLLRSIGFVSWIALSSGDDALPLQRIPMASSNGSISDFTVWTPKNWTPSSSSTKIYNNLYMLKIYDGSAFHVIVPGMTDSKRFRFGSTP